MGRRDARRPDDHRCLFAGAARTKLRSDNNLTLGSAQPAEAAAILGAPDVVVVHCDSWTHFTEQCPTVAPAFEAAGLSGVLRRPTPGERLTLG